MIKTCVIFLSFVVYSFSVFYGENDPLPFSA